MHKDDADIRIDKRLDTTYADVYHIESISTCLIWTENANVFRMIQVIVILQFLHLYSVILFLFRPRT
jgi:hypothetical protein